MPALRSASAQLAERQAQGRAGFLTLDRASWQIDRAVELGRTLAQRAHTLVVLGIGGSALGARALEQALASGDQGHHLVVADSVDPVAVRRWMARLDPQDTAVAVVSKSGETVETAALFRVLIPWLQARRPSDWKERVVLVTDAQRGTLRPFAEAHDLPALPVPDDVGGRFSVLTAVGALPAAFLGLDVEALFAGAEAMRSEVITDRLETNPAWRWAALHDAAWGHANINVLMPYCDRLRSFGEWFQQLWGESLGKPEGAGAYGWTPVVAMGPVDQHSQLQLYQEGPRDKVVCLLGVDDPGADLPISALSGPEDGVAPWLAGASLARLIDAERIGTMAALVEAGRPVIDLRLPRVDARTIGGAILFFEAATALAGLMRGLDPFDQPGVEAGKRFASGLLGRPEYRERQETAMRLLGRNA